MMDKGHIILRKVFQLINIKNERSIKLTIRKIKVWLGAKVNGWKFKEKQDMCLISKSLPQYVLVTVENTGRHHLNPSDLSYHHQ